MIELAFEQLVMEGRTKRRGWKAGRSGEEGWKEQELWGEGYV